MNVNANDVPVPDITCADSTTQLRYKYHLVETKRPVLEKAAVQKSLLLL